MKEPLISIIQFSVCFLISFYFHQGAEVLFSALASFALTKILVLWIASVGKSIETLTK